MWQEIIVFIIIFLAAFFVIFSIIRKLFFPKKQNCCNGCALRNVNCPKNSQKKC